MSSLAVLGFEATEGSEPIRHETYGSRKRRPIEADGAAVVTRDEDGRATVKGADRLFASGALGAAGERRTTRAETALADCPERPADRLMGIT